MVDGVIHFGNIEAYVFSLALQYISAFFEEIS